MVWKVGSGVENSTSLKVTPSLTMAVVLTTLKTNLHPAYVSVEPKERQEVAMCVRSAIEKAK